MRYHGPESARARQKNTPLHEAAAANDLEGARALIEEGADPDATGVGLATPLHAAAREHFSRATPIRTPRTTRA
jgi:ankyrin repeat protein